MDFGSIINTIMSSDSVSQLSSLTGTDEKDVSSILTSALPQLLSGAQGQATNADTAQSFANALAAHGQKDSADLSSFLSGIDLDDGQKIVNHLLGSDNAVATAETLSQESGVASGTGTHTNPFDFDRRMGDYIGGYHTMEEAVAEGKVRSIGVSNFSTAQFEEIMAEAVIPPPPYSRWKRICITSKTA